MLHAGSQTYWTCSLRVVVVAVNREDGDSDVQVGIFVINRGKAVIGHFLDEQDVRPRINWEGMPTESQLSCRQTDH